MAGMIAGMLLAVIGTAAMSVWAQGRPLQAGGPGLFMGDPAHMERGIDHLLKGVDATDAQRAKIKQIVQAATGDLKAQREAGRALHEQGLQLFMAPVVDAAAVEALRQQSQALHDLVSKRVTQAMLDISAVLTPEQRVKLGERIQQRAEKMREHRQHGASAPAN